MLEARSAAWNARPETRQLPSLWEYLTIVGRTSRERWTEPQRTMMRVARNRHGIRFVTTCGLLALVCFGTMAAGTRYRAFQEQTRVAGLIDQYLVAGPSELSSLSQQLELEPEYGIPQLQKIAADPLRSESDRLRANLVLATDPGEYSSYLLKTAYSAGPEMLKLIRDRIKPYAASATDELWQTALNSDSPPSVRLRAASLLADLDANSANWDELAKLVVAGVAAEDVLQLEHWLDLLQPVSQALAPNWKSRFLEQSLTAADYEVAARALCKYAEPAVLCDTILAAEPALTALLLPGTQREPEAVISILKKEIPANVSTSLFVPEEQRRLRNAAIGLLRLKQFEAIVPLISTPADPSIRTELILNAARFGISPDLFFEALDQVEDTAARQAVLLAFDSYGDGEFSDADSQHLHDMLLNLLRTGARAAERSAAECLLRRRGFGDQVNDQNRALARIVLPDDPWLHEHDWWVNSQQQIMAVFSAPRTVTLGSPTAEKDREEYEDLREVTFHRRFAVGLFEVSIGQFEAFRPDAKFSRDVARTSDCPANSVSLLESMQFCRWLSEQENIAEDQMCYPVVGEMTAAHAMLDDDRLNRTGYRLLTEDEWEFVCRAGSATPWFVGDDPLELYHFAWGRDTSDDHQHSVTTMLPNQFGLFNVCGNVAEWCHPSSPFDSIVLKGGAYRSSSGSMRSAARYSQSDSGFSFTGLRIARTIQVPPPN